MKHKEYNNYDTLEEMRGIKFNFQREVHIFNFRHS